MRQLGTTDEHIIPRSIGGGLIIKNGTCIGCLKRIQSFEAKLLSTHFASAQALLGIKTGSGRPRRGFKGPRWSGDGLSARWDYIRPEEHSGVITTVNYERPGIEVGRPPQAGFGRNYYITLTQIAPGARVPPGEKINLMSTMPIGREHDFVPFLAKIAHAYWVSQEGHGTAHFLLPPLILDKHLYLAGYLIGRCDDVMPDDDLHVIRHRKTIISGKYWGCVDIALFSCFNSPAFQSRYTVYIGKLITAPYIFLRPHQSP